MSESGSRSSTGGSVRADEGRGGGSSGTDSRDSSQMGSSTDRGRAGGQSGTGAGTGGGGQLVTDRGTTSIADSVVMKVANMAAREIPAVADLGGGVGSAIGNVVGRIRGAENQTTGVSAEVGERQAAIDLTLRVYYPASIQEVSDAVRQNVIQRVESTTGLQVVEVNINVTDLTFPGEEDDSGQQQEQTQSRVQ